MVGSNSDTFTEAFLRTYDTAEVEQLEQINAKLISRIYEAPDKQFGGEGMRFSIRTKGNQSVRYGTEDGALPTAQSESFQQPVVTAALLYATARWTGVLEAKTAKSQFAFVQAGNDAIRMAAKRALKYQEGAFFRDGTGELTQVSSVSGTTVTATSGNIQWLDVNTTVEFYSSGSRVAGPVKVTDVDVLNNTFTTETDVSALLTAGDAVYKAGTHSPTSVTNAEILGTGAALATTGSYLGVSRSDVRVWQAQVLDAGSSDIDEDRLYQAEERILTLAGYDEIENLDIITHPTQFRKFFKLVNSRRRFAGESGSADAGLKYGNGVMWEGKELIQSYNCQRDTIYMIPLSTVQRFTLPGGEMQLDATGQGVVKWVPGFDASFAFWKQYSNIAFRQPNACAKISSLATPSK